MNIASSIAVLVYTAGGLLLGYIVGYSISSEHLLGALFSPLGALGGYKYARWMDRKTNT